MYNADRLGVQKGNSGLVVSPENMNPRPRRADLFLAFFLTLVAFFFGSNVFAPVPDGLLSVLLIFPVAILGMRLAGASPIQRTRRRRIITGVILGICVLLGISFTSGLAAILLLIPLLVILIYGIVRGIQIMRLGQGGKRFFVGAAVIAWAILGIGDYIGSVKNPDTPTFFENSAAARLRSIANAESTYIDPKYSKRAASPVYGTLEDLSKADLISDSFVSRGVWDGYLYGELVDPMKKQFLFYAVPAYVYKPKPTWWMFVPGKSLLRAYLRGGQQPTGIRSFAVDDRSDSLCHPRRHSAGDARGVRALGETQLKRTIVARPTEDSRMTGRKTLSEHC